MGLRRLAALAALSPANDDHEDAAPPARLVVPMVSPFPAPTPPEPLSSVDRDDATEVAVSGLLAAFPGATLVRNRGGSPRDESPEAEHGRARATLLHFAEQRRRAARACPEVYVSRACNVDHWGDVAETLRDVDRGNQMDLKVTTRHLVENGWAFHLQTRTPDKCKPRKDGKADRKPCCGNSSPDVSPKRMAVEGTTEEQRLRWIDKAPSRGRQHYPNVALVMGPYARTFAIDADTYDSARSVVVLRLMVEVLGVTPYLRTRIGPKKFAAVYRLPADADWLRLRSGTKIKWSDGDAIEILGQGASPYALR